jgi:hypothetical protein
MRGFVAALGMTVSLLGAAALWAGSAEAKEIQEFTAGQWTGFSYVDDNSGQFTDCTVWAFNTDNVQVGISVKKDWNLVLWLNSKTWNLPTNQSYPVSFWIDRNAQYHGKAEVSGAKFVDIAVSQGDAVFNELKQGGQLTFRTKDVDYVFDLSGSRAALSRLLGCVDQYAKASTNNPFGGGDDGQQSSTSQDSSQQDSNQQNNNQQQANNGGSQNSSESVKTLSVSLDDVHKFLTEVTGAKPSMITVVAKTDKQGAPYYNFSTPLGEGEYWQEQLSGGQVQDVALDYLAGYKGDCKGEYEQVLGDPAQGPHGRLAVGTAACSNSPYQNNGPEFVSFAMVEADGLVSIYMTYTGGNAAKAKSDSLGKLIAKRSSEQIQ